MVTTERRSSNTVRGRIRCSPRRRDFGAAAEEDRLTRSRRATAGLRQVEQSSEHSSPGPLVDAQVFGVFDSRRLGNDWPPQRKRTDPATGDAVEGRHPAVSSVQPSTTVPRFVSPILVLLAAASILGGYRRLNVIPAGGLQPSALVFAALAFPVAMVLARPRSDGRRVVAAKAVAVGAVILLGVTLLALLVDRPWFDVLMGASDLLFAATALVAFLANERYARRGA
jgi:hypothetical protein